MFQDICILLIFQLLDVSGHLMLIGGLGAYALSKELFVIHEEVIQETLFLIKITIESTDLLALK